MEGEEGRGLMLLLCDQTALFESVKHPLCDELMLVSTRARACKRARAHAHAESVGILQRDTDANNPSAELQRVHYHHL